MQWTSSFIRVWFFARAKIPADITAGTPDPSKWGLPTANFDSANGACNIDANFPAQTVVSFALSSTIFLLFLFFFPSQFRIRN